MVEAIASALLDEADDYAVELWLFDRFGKRSPESYAKLFADHLTHSLGLRAAERPHKTELIPPGRQVLDAPLATGPDAASRARAAYEMLRRLDARRAELEEQLVEALIARTDASADTLERCRRQLDEVRELRLGYESDLLHLTGQARTVGQPRSESVFLSSTYIDLKLHREAVKAVIQRMSFSFVGMEDFAPSSAAPVSYIRQQVERAGLYMGILGMRYGYVDPGTGRSMTELEYEQALASDKQLLLFVMDKDAPITVEMVETDPEAYAKLLAFRNRVLDRHMCRFFTTRADLVTKAEDALRVWMNA
jgi:hypothetical protein